MSDTETTTEDRRVTRAREAVAVDFASYDELVDTDPLKLRDVAISHHAVIESLLAYIDARHATVQAVEDLIARYDRLPGNAYIPIGLLRDAAGWTAEERT